MRFLIITKNYPPNSDVSGQIAWNIVSELVQRSHTIDVIDCSNSKIKISKGIRRETIYHVRNTYWDRMLIKRNSDTSLIFCMWFLGMTFLRKLYLAINIFQFPNSEPSISKKIFKVYNDELVGKQYDCIISFFRPFSSIIAGIKIKESIGAKTCLISYILDLVEAKDCPKLMPKRLYNKLIFKGDLLLFKKSDFVILPVSARSICNSIHEKNAEKIHYWEFPSFIEPPVMGKYSSNSLSSEIVMIFAGTLSKNFRDPRKLLFLLNETAKRLPQTIIRVKLFIKGDCINLIQSFKTIDNLIIETSGWVEKNIIEYEMMRADFIINITNKYKAIIPSKIFELFATGKPILNVITEGDDGSESYFERYPLHFRAIWSTTHELDMLVGDLCVFLNKNKGNTLEIEEMKKAFYQCTPNAVINNLLEVLRNYNGTKSNCVDK